MTTYETPTAIDVQVDVVGNVRITASDRTDTVVVVHPLDPSKRADVKAAAETTVDLTNGRLTVRTPKHWTRFTPMGGGESVDVAIEVPSGSHVDARTGLGDLQCEGEIGTCRLKSAMGAIRIDHATTVKATTGFGDLTVDHVVGDAEVTTGSGEVQVGDVGGSLVVKNSNGDTTIGAAGGEVRAKAANGDIAVGRASASVSASSACGSVRVAEAQAGRVDVETATGDLEVGIAPGVAAWLDVTSRYGTVRNDLDVVDGPGRSDGTVEVRARTAVGNIVIRRAAADSKRRAS